MRLQRVRAVAWHLPAPAVSGWRQQPSQPCTNHQAQCWCVRWFGGYVGQRGRAGTGFPAGL